MSIYIYHQLEDSKQNKNEVRIQTKDNISSVDDVMKKFLKARKGNKGIVQSIKPIPPNNIGVRNVITFKDPKVFVDMLMFMGGAPDGCFIEPPLQDTKCLCVNDPNNLNAIKYIQLVNNDKFNISMHVDQDVGKIDDIKGAEMSDIKNPAQKYSSTWMINPCAIKAGLPVNDDPANPVRITGITLMLDSKATMPSNEIKQPITSNTVEKFDPLIDLQFESKICPCYQMGVCKCHFNDYARPMIDQVQEKFGSVIETDNSNDVAEKEKMLEMERALKPIGSIIDGKRFKVETGSLNPDMCYFRYGIGPCPDRNNTCHYDKPNRNFYPGSPAYGLGHRSSDILFKSPVLGPCPHTKADMANVVIKPDYQRLNTDKLSSVDNKIIQEGFKGIESQKKVFDVLYLIFILVILGLTSWLGYEIYRSKKKTI